MWLAKGSGLGFLLGEGCSASARREALLLIIACGASASKKRPDEISTV
jgi:hypothetical protein